jgi:hypothetical protein
MAISRRRSGSSLRSTAGHPPARERDGSTAIRDITGGAPVWLGRTVAAGAEQVWNAAARVARRRAAVGTLERVLGAAAIAPV